MFGLNRRFLSFFVLSVFGGLIAGCGTGASGNSSTVALTSLSQIPDVADIVSGSDAASLRTKSSVTGTPPILSSITQTNADTYFWNGLIAELNTAGTATEEQRNTFWAGEGACRMAQATGYSFQNVIQGGSSLCYMKNAPSAAAGVTIVSGSVPDVSQIFNQSAGTRVVGVQITGSPNPDEDQPDQNIFIRVHGTDSEVGSAGYAADLWFCNEGNSTPRGYETIRVNANELASTSYNSDFGTFGAVITASLVENASGDIMFDTTQERNAHVFFEGEGNNFEGFISVSGDFLTSKIVQTGSFQENSFSMKNYIVSQFSGDSLSNLVFEAAGFHLENTFNDFTNTFGGASEFHDTFYESLQEGDLFDLVDGFDFADDAFFEGGSETLAGLAAAMANYDCSTTPDVVVSMDFNVPEVQAVAAICENFFQDMNFCDGDAIQEARQIVFNSQQP